MAVLRGYVTKEEFEEIKKRKDITILDKVTEDIGEWKGYLYVGLDCNWSVMEFLNNFGDN